MSTEGSGRETAPSATGEPSRAGGADSSGLASRLAEQIAVQAVACAHFGSPFYAALLQALAGRVCEGEPIAAMLAPHAQAPWRDAIALRLLGGVHRLVLAGQAPALAAHYPSTGGDGDAAACVEPLLEIVAAHRDFLAPLVARPPQTNEVARSASLAPGFAWVAARHGPRLRLLELGSSAGLNLRFDAFRYEAGAVAAGPRSSPVVFRDLWSAVPPLATPIEVVERRGCDSNPMDACDPDTRLALLGYVWPDQAERLALLRAALSVAASLPVAIDRAAIADWLPQRLAGAEAGADGVTTVVFHSIVWPYLDETTRAAVHEALDAAGRRVPLAWLRLEPDESYQVELRVTTWPGAQETLLARTVPHLGPVEWLA